MRSFFLALALASSTPAGDLIHEAFSGPGLPEGWSTGGRPESWSVMEKVWIDDVRISMQ